MSHVLRNDVKIDDLAELTSVSSSGDYLMIKDSIGGVLKKVKIETLLLAASGLDGGVLADGNGPSASHTITWDGGGP